MNVNTSECMQPTLKTTHVSWQARKYELWSTSIKIAVLSFNFRIKNLNEDIWKTTQQINRKSLDKLMSLFDAFKQTTELCERSPWHT